VVVQGMDGRSDSIQEGIDDHLHSGSQLVFLVGPRRYSG
jgi:hypothetical protein